jgi:hypothetical protein
MGAHDIETMRELVQRYLVLANDPANAVKRDLWRRHNAREQTRIPVYARAFAWAEMPDRQFVCADPFWHPYEDQLRSQLFRASFEDDWVFEPWLVVEADRDQHPDGYWGTRLTWLKSDHPHGGKAMDNPLKTPDDVRKLIRPRQHINEAATQARLARVQDAVGDLITVTVNRAPISSVWHGDISTDLGHLRGIGNLMFDMMDRPDWLHALLAFMRDAILDTHRAAEEAGDWRLLNHENQSVPYAADLADPAPHSPPVKRRQLWYFCASQETTLLGPAQFDEFMLQYQLPIMAEFGLVAYGCCEDLTRKLDLLRQIPNLRRIAIAPLANVSSCAEQLGRAYVMSYRPSPADMVAYRFDEQRIRRILTRDLTACRAHDCCVDICLKDVETVERDPTRIRRWNKLTRQVIDELYG